MKARRIVILTTILLVALLLAPKPVAASLHDPPGTQANSGTVYSGNSKMVAFVQSGYSTTIWTGVSADEYKGDFDFRGDATSFAAYYIDFYCLIKIKPADSSHKYLQIAINADFEYGISAGWLSSASWELQYVVMDMGQNPPYAVGWSQYKPGDSVVGGYKNDQEFAPSTSYKDIYNSLYYSSLKEFSTSEWYYVGIHLRAGLYGWANFYKTSNQNGYADWETHWIKWYFHENP